MHTGNRQSGFFTVIFEIKYTIGHDLHQQKPIACTTYLVVRPNCVRVAIFSFLFRFYEIQKIYTCAKNYYVYLGRLRTILHFFYRSLICISLMMIIIINEIYTGPIIIGPVTEQQCPGVSSGSRLRHVYSHKQLSHIWWGKYDLATLHILPAVFVCAAVSGSMEFSPWSQSLLAFLLLRGKITSWGI